MLRGKTADDRAIPRKHVAVFQQFRANKIKGRPGQNGHAAEDVSRDEPAKENPAALRRNKEIPGATAGQEIETGRWIPLARDHRVGEEVALGCGSQDGIDVPRKEPKQERRTQVGT